MSVYQSTKVAPLGAITALRIVTLVEGALVALVNWRRRRETQSALLKLSDHQLADIGLHRGAVALVAQDLTRR